MQDWIVGVILALFIIVPCWLAILRAKETQRQVEAWSKLAQRTGLTCPPGYPRSVRGDYRGRYLCLALITFSDSDGDALMYQNTSMSLNVQNSACFALSIQAKGIREYIRKITEVPSGNQDFDRRFSATGSPREYVQGAVDLIVQSDPRLLVWIMQKFPTVELQGENLICNQNGELTSVDDQIALLNLLCDLAELVERGKAESAGPIERRI